MQPDPSFIDILLDQLVKRAGAAGLLYQVIAIVLAALLMTLVIWAGIKGWRWIAQEPPKLPTDDPRPADMPEAKFDENVRPNSGEPGGPGGGG
jgi:hypothetical protein